MSTFVVLVLKCYFRACLVIKRINVLIYKQCFFTFGCKCFAFSELSAVLLQATYVLIIIIDVFFSGSEWLFRRRFLCHTTQAEYLCNYRLITKVCYVMLYCKKYIFKWNTVLQKVLCYCFTIMSRTQIKSQGLMCFLSL